MTESASALCLAGLAAVTGVVLGHLVHGVGWTTGSAVIALVVIVRWWSARYRAKTIRRVAPALLFVAALFLVAQAVAASLFGPLGRAAGLLPHANIAAATAVSSWMLALAALQRARLSPIVDQVVKGSISAVALYVVLAAGTRSVALGLMAGSVVAVIVWATRPIGHRWTTKVIGSLLLAITSLATVVAATVALRADVTNPLGSFERGPIFITALKVAALSPWVGHGDGAWMSQAPVVEPSLPLGVAQHAHSVPLTLFIEGGAFGLVGVAMLAMVVLAYIGNQVRNRSGWATPVMLVGLVALGIQGLVDTVFYYPSVYLPVVAAGLLSCTGPLRVRVGESGEAT